MPQQENFWNPYRWVPASNDSVRREQPLYRHRFQGLSGRLECTLTALTPFLINDGSGKFIRSRKHQQPFIPATSLKGCIRSLAELIGNAANPFPKGQVDAAHQLNQAAVGDGSNRQLDMAARTFGYLLQESESKVKDKVFAGLIHFSDGRLQGKEPSPLSCVVAVGQPKPTHRAFYPGNTYRKLYHHHVGATRLVPPHPGITQTSTVHPLPPGVTFTFRVDFENLREEELALLLYCLALEEKVTVEFSAAAMGGSKPVTLTGPMRHKLGHCKPHGGGSVHIQIDSMLLHRDPRARYRGKEETTTPPQEDVLQKEIRERTQKEIRERTQAIRQRNDATMRHLRAMMIYAEDDPRAKNINYPTFAWFNTHSARPLRPTL